MAALSIAGDRGDAVDFDVEMRAGGSFGK